MITLECENCSYYEYGLGGQYCEKTGGKTLLYGYCSDAYLDIQKQINRSKQKRINKRERDQKYKYKLKRLSGHISSTHMYVEYMDEIYIRNQGYIRNPKPYYKKFYYGENCKRRYKKISNKHVRRYKGEIHSGGMYRKVFDYKWSVD